MSNQVQRVCCRCRVIFTAGPAETFCPNCQDSLCRSEERKKRIRQQTEPPENPFIECLIDRPGDTACQIGGAKYIFKRDEQGRPVCRINNPSHHKFLLKQTSLYRLYQPVLKGGEVVP